MKIALIGGGPGISPSYLQDGLGFLAKDHELVTYGVSNLNSSLWNKEYEEFLKSEKIEAVVGHSFGGILAMNSKVTSDLKKIVLLSTFPLERAGEINSGLPEYDKNFYLKYLADKNDKTFKDAFIKSWGSLFFTKESLNKGQKILADYEYNHAVYEQSIKWYETAKTNMSFIKNVIVWLGKKIKEHHHGLLIKLI